FRAGTIIYIEGDLRLKFYHEMCGGGVHFSIDIPAEADWEAATGRPLPNACDPRPDSYIPPCRPPFTS
ncbi:MAG TPA: hypothetical protein PKW75_11680, partial [candidate division Zixibacteria bacterium]|nr:hypothetical protein [candidate division Zixibacteria bacterium]